jgi:biopolymer transport protein ExbB
MEPVSNVLKLLNEGGFTMYMLVLCSILLLGVVFERFYSMRNMYVDAEWLLAQMTFFLENRRYGEALHFCKQVPGALARVFETGLLRIERKPEEMETAMGNTITEQSLLMEKNLTIVATLAVIAPFVGLFGTVLGIIRAFQDIALKGTTGPAVVSKGVAEALIATAAGLFVAITAVVFYNFFKGKIKTIITHMTVSANKLIEIIALVKAGAPIPEDLKTYVAVPKQATEIPTVPGAPQAPPAVPPPYPGNTGQQQGPGY